MPDISRPPAPRVVVVRPRGLAADSCCDALRLGGFDPRHTAEVEAALSMLVEVRAAALVLDLSMPDVDVLDLSSAVRRHERARDVVVIALTEKASADAVALALARGCDRVLQADAPVHLVVRELESALAKRERAVVAAELR